MKQTIEKLDLIENLSEESKKEIELQNAKLRLIKGATFIVDEVTPASVTISVKNINGKRTGKYELLTDTYSIFSKHIPAKYRVLVKL
jgi:hypothetical protein